MPALCCYPLLPHLLAWCGPMTRSTSGTRRSSAWPSCAATHLQGTSSGVMGTLCGHAWAAACSRNCGRRRFQMARGNQPRQPLRPAISAAAAPYATAKQQQQRTPPPRSSGRPCAAACAWLAAPAPNTASAPPFRGCCTAAQAGGVQDWGGGAASMAAKPVPTPPIQITSCECDHGFSAAQRQHHGSCTTRLAPALPPRCAAHLHVL